MKVYLVWYMYPYDPMFDVLKVFNSEEKAQQYIDDLLNNPNEDYDKRDLYIEEKEVE